MPSQTLHSCIEMPQWGCPAPPSCSHHAASKVGEPKLEKKISECFRWSKYLPFTRYTKLKSSNAPSFGVTHFSASSGAVGCLSHTSVLIVGLFLPSCAESSRHRVPSFSPAPNYPPPTSYDLPCTGTLTQEIPTSTHTAIWKGLAQMTWKHPLYYNNTFR